MSYDAQIVLRQPEPESDDFDENCTPEAIVDRIYMQLDRMLQFESRAQGSWLVQQVSDYFNPLSSMESLAPPAHVSWLLWEEINAGRIHIDKYGGVKRASSASV